MNEIYKDDDSLDFDKGDFAKIKTEDLPELPSPSLLLNFIYEKVVSISRPGPSTIVVFEIDTQDSVKQFSIKGTSRRSAVIKAYRKFLEEV